MKRFTVLSVVQSGILLIGMIHPCSAYGEKEHRYMVSKAVDYLYAQRSPATRYPLKSLLSAMNEGSDYADSTPLSITWKVPGYERTFTCDQMHHYGLEGNIRALGKFLMVGGGPYTFNINSVVGDTGDLAAPYYARILFDQAVRFWPGGLSPSLSLLPKKRGVTAKLLGKSKYEGATYVGGFPYCDRWSEIQTSFPSAPSQVSVPAASPKWPSWASKPGKWMEDTYKIPIESRTNAMKYLGWAVHLIQDVTVPENAVNYAIDGDPFETVMENWIGSHYDTHHPAKPSYTPGAFASVEDIAGEARKQGLAISGFATRKILNYTIVSYSGGSGMVEKILDVAVKLTAATIEKYFEEMDWNQIGTPAAKLYAAENRLCATNPQTGDIFLYNGGVYPEQHWSRIGEGGADFKIHHKSFYRLSADRMRVDLIAFVPGSNEFQGQWKAYKIRDRTDRLYGGPFGVFATDLIQTVSPTKPLTIHYQPGDIYQFVGSSSNPMWKRVGGPGRAFAVGRNHLYGLSSDGKSVFRYDGSTWKGLGKPAGLGMLDTLYAGGDRLYATQFVSPTRTADIYAYDASKGLWQRAGGPGKAFAVDDQGVLFALSPDDAPAGSRGIHARMDGMDWRLISDPDQPFASIASAGDQHLYGIDSAGQNVWQFKPNGDLAAIDWCYSLPDSEIRFGLVVRNTGRSAWMSDQEGWASFTVSFDDGHAVHVVTGTEKLNPDRLRPGHSAVVAVVTLPYASTWKYFIGSGRIFHPKERGEADNVFDPPVNLRSAGIKGSRLALGGDPTLVPKRCCN